MGSLQDFELQVMKNLKCMVCERAVQQLIMDQNNGTVDQNNGTDLDARIAKGLAGCENSQKLNDIAEKAPKLAAAAKDECKTSSRSMLKRQLFSWRRILDLLHMRS